MVTVFEHFSAGKNLYAKFVSPVCKEYGLTQMEFNILLFLANNPSHTTAAQIVKYRNLTKSHVSMSVKSLQEKGLLATQEDGTDRRVSHLHITQKAAAVVQAGQKAQRQFGRQLVEGFTPEEISELQNYLRRIHKNMTEGE